MEEVIDIISEAYVLAQEAKVILIHKDLVPNGVIICRGNDFKEISVGVVNLIDPIEIEQKNNMS